MADDKKGVGSPTVEEDGPFDFKKNGADDEDHDDHDLFKSAMEVRFRQLSKLL